MSYNILNKNVNFQGPTQGTIEDIVDTHSDQVITGSKDFHTLTGSNAYVKNNLGIGTNNPSEPLHVMTTGNGGVEIEATSGAATLTFDMASNDEGRILFKEATESRASIIYDGTGAHSMIFKGRGTNTEVMRINSAGNVGIGTNNPSTKLHVDGNVTATHVSCTNVTASGTVTVTGTISGSGAISGSAFFGDGSNLSGVGVSLASNGGLANSSGILVDPNNATETTSADGSDFLLVADAGDSNNLKKITCQRVANLFDQAVSTFNGQTQHRVVTVGGAETIEGEANLTFNGSVLSVTGDVSGSGQLQIGGDITGSAISVQTIALADVSSLAGAGLINNSGVLDIEVTGAVKLASDRVGITGSIAGNGLAFAGGADSVSSLAVNLESNSGLAVASSGLKLNMNSLASATPAAASDSVTFIDSDGDKKCSFSTFLTAIAGSGIGVNNSQLTASAGSVDIDALSALGGTGLHQTQDHFMFSDNGTEKKITFSNLEDAIFANVSSDATIAAGGALTIADNAVSLAKMAGLARGKIIIGDASGDPSALTLGSAGQLLVSDGDDLLYRTLGGDASLGADGTLTIAANAVEGSMLNSNVAGSGLDYTSNELRVDVSDFMANGVDNRVLTATGTDAMTGEANLTFNGSLLTINGTGSSDRIVIGDTDPAESRLLISGSNTENLFQMKQQGNGYPTMFLAGESHATYPGVFYNRGKYVNGGAISQGNLEGDNGSHTRLTVRKVSITDDSATSIVTVTVPNANHAAAIRVFWPCEFR